MMENSDAFFCNKECKYFPCHKVEDEDKFNCLFCYCPLYFLDESCGGNFKYSASGKKDCKNCAIPHGPDSRKIIVERLKQNGKH